MGGSINGRWEEEAGHDSEKWGVGAYMIPLVSRRRNAMRLKGLGIGI